MKLIDRFYQGLAGAMAKRFDGKAYGQILKALGEHPGLTLPDFGVMENQEKAYEMISWVHIAVSRIAKGVAQVPFKVFKKGSKPEVPEEVHNHPLVKLLSKPNDDMTRFELWESTVGYLLLTGNAYWFLSGGPGKPRRIQVLRSDRVYVVPAKKGSKMIAGYVYKVGAESIPLDEEEILHFKLFHPRSDFYGMSPMEAAAIAAETDHAQATWNKNYFANEKAVPAGMVVVKGTISKSDFERFKEDWKDSYGGKQRKTAIVRANDVDWKNIQHSQKEMEFLSSRGFNKQEIFDIYDVPLGATDPSSTEANAVTGLNYFKEYTLWPLLTRLQEVVTQDLLPFWNKSLFGRFDDIRPIDRQLQLEEEKAKRDIRTFDEARALAGLEPFTDPTGNDLGKLPFATVQRATISELLQPEVGDDGEPVPGAPKDSDDRKRDRSNPIDDNPANKPKKRKQGMAAKPQRATKNIYFQGLPMDMDLMAAKHQAAKALAIVRELKIYEKYLRKRLENGKTMADIRPFNPEVLPLKPFNELNEQIFAIKSIEDLDVIFGNALALNWRGDEATIEDA